MTLPAIALDEAKRIGDAQRALRHREYEKTSETIAAERGMAWAFELVCSGCGETQETRRDVRGSIHDCKSAVWSKITRSQFLRDHPAPADEKEER